MYNNAFSARFVLFSTNQLKSLSTITGLLHVTFLYEYKLSFKTHFVSEIIGHTVQNGGGAPFFC